MSTKLQKELDKAIQRRDELASDREAVRELLSTRRDEMANVVYERGNPDKLLSEIQKLLEKDGALSAALAKAEAVISELRDELAENRKAAALKELDRLSSIGEKHIIGFFAGLYQAKREGQLAKNIFREMYENQHKNDLLSEEYQLMELVTWVEDIEARNNVFLNKFDQANPDLAKDAQR